MAETVFDNLRIRGTLTLVGVTMLVTAIITTLTVTTLTATTGNFQTMSGATLKLGGGTTTITGTTSGTLTIVGAIRGMSTLSGASTLTLSPLGPSVNKLACIKAGGTLGYIAVTASGTIAKSSGAISCQ